MFPVTYRDKSARKTSRVIGQISFAKRITTHSDHQPAVTSDISPVSVASGSPLTLEKESTRRAREAKARARQKQNDTSGGVWNGVWSTGWDDSEDSLDPMTGQARRLDGHLALAPEADQSPVSVQQQAADIEPCVELARRALAAAKKADAEGDSHAALQHYAMVVDNGSSDPQVFFRMGVLLRQTKGDPRQSLDLLRKATVLRPDQMKYRNELADLYETLGFYINARSQRKQIRQLEETVSSKRSHGFSSRMTMR
jgi:tetratricopeptide (TPR) repeat protein